MAFVIAMEQSSVPIYQIEQFTEKDMFPEAYRRLLGNMGFTSDNIPDVEFFVQNLGKELSGESLKINSKIDFPSETITVGFFDLEDIISNSYYGFSCACCQYYNKGNEMDCVTPYVDLLAIIPETKEFKERQLRDQYLMGIRKGICPYMAFKFRDYCPLSENLEPEIGYDDYIL